MDPTREKEDDAGKKGCGVSGVVGAEVGTGNKDGDEVESQKKMKTRKVERKELRHLQVRRRCWIGNEEQSCDSQCRMGT